MQSAEKGEVAGKLLEPGDMFGDYTVEKLLGKGGMGAVYLVRAPDGERYAVKLMFPEIASKNPDFRKRFAREAEFAMKIKHKNLISVYDVGEDPETGYCYIIMDYVPGGSVKDRLAAKGALPIAEAVSIAAQIALALEVAHRYGVIHRDIKPDNIMFDADGTPKLADLGVAKFTDDEHKTTVTTTGMIIGTPAYMAPEQMMDSHHIDARADIYALGVVLYEMLTGKRPTEGSSAVELLAKALKGEALPDVRTMRPEISAAIAHVLSLMCAPKPEERPPTTLAVAQLLQQAATGQLKLPKKRPRAADAQRTKRPFPVAACVMGALVLGAALFGWRAWSSRQKTPTGTTGVSPVDVGASGTPRPTAVRGSGTLAASKKQPDALYCVVDLSAGPNAEKYPLSYLNAEPKGGWTEEYKTRKLVLRRIEPGSFKMGGRYDVTLTKAFYIGVFEVTQRQYELVTGDNPSDSKGDTRPVEKVSYDMIRGKDTGARWPASSAVDSDSFMGKLRTRTGLDSFDLPTEAQWEYACRAGTTSLYNNGGDSKGDLMKLGRFALNQKRRGYRETDADVARHEPDGKGGCLEGHTFAGSYLPSAWGLYDMHGNVWEWCLDWWCDKLSIGGTNSVGLSSGTSRVARGGCWYSSDAYDCTSSGRNNYSPSSRLNRIGFRLVVGPDLVAEWRKTRGLPSPQKIDRAAERRRWILPPAFKTPQERTLTIAPGVTMTFCACPAGSFMMSNAPGQGKKQHKVVITRPFWIGKMFVTTKQFVTYLNTTSVNAKSAEIAEKEFPECDLVSKRWGRNPVNYCTELNADFGEFLPDGYVFRLPTEAELEYAVTTGGSVPLTDAAVCHDEQQTRAVAARKGIDVYEALRLFPPSAPVNAWGLSVGWTDTEQVVLDCLDGAKGTDGAREALAYANTETDPVRTGRFFLQRRGCQERVLADGGAKHLFRVCIGPDLLKEKGLDKAPSAHVKHEVNGMPATSVMPIPSKETSPRPKPLAFDLGKGEALEFVGCPSGSFYMGVPGTSTPVRKGHSVEITRPFWFGKYPVTIGQWEKLMPQVELPHGVDRKNIDSRVPIQALNVGGMGLNAQSIETFMARLMRKFGKQLPSGYVFRFPTEAEWEYAFKANSNDSNDPHVNLGATGEEISKFFVLMEASERYWRPRGFPSKAFEKRKFVLGPYIPVGERRPNAWGIYDMGGITCEPILDSWVNTKEEWAREANPWKRLEHVVERNPPMRQDGIRDPLLFEPDRAGAMRMRWTRQGFNPHQHPIEARHYLNWEDKYNPRCVMLRLVVGPDLLKERGITPPVPNENTKDVRSPSVGVIPDTSNKAQGVSDALYCVVDLSAGPNAKKYPVSYLSAEPKGGWTDEYKTSKLVLRRIEPGSFKMIGKHDVTLTKPFYCGIFEVTQKQYELVTGENPSEFKGDMRPVEKVSYDMIRGKDAGASWPASSAVDSSSFMGKLRARTGIDGFDLPTEAQWEYACRAGTTSKYNNGGDSDSELKKLGRYGGDRSDGKGGYSGKHTTVGSYQPNVWGIYDMHGNVWELCLDRRRGDPPSGGTDPVGSSTGKDRVKRGGSWVNRAGNCASSLLHHHSPSHARHDVGFRLAISPDLLKEQQGTSYGIVDGAPRYFDCGLTVEVENESVSRKENK